MLQPAPEFDSFKKRMGLVILIGFLLLGVVSAKSAYEVQRFSLFVPSWFPTLFSIGIAGLIGFSGVVALSVLRGCKQSEWMGRRPGAAMIAVLSLVAVCTTSVHQFYPFRADVVEQWAHANAILKFNMALAVLAAIAPLAIALAYWHGRERVAMTALFVLALILLIPNDDCFNDFNIWWLDVLGQSPLMFVPLVYALLFVAAAVVGANVRLSLLGCAGVTLAVLALGYGHMTRIIW